MGKRACCISVKTWVQIPCTQIKLTGLNIESSLYSISQCSAQLRGKLLLSWEMTWKNIYFVGCLISTDSQCLMVVRTASPMILSVSLSKWTMVSWSYSNLFFPRLDLCRSLSLHPNPKPTSSGDFITGAEGGLHVYMWVWRSDHSLRCDPLRKSIMVFETRSPTDGEAGAC